MDPAAGSGGWLFDEAAIRWLQGQLGTSVRLPFEIVSLLGDTWGLLLAIGIALWVFGRRHAFAVAAAISLASPLWLGLASLFSVERPAGPGFVVMEHLEAGAFPSGHVFHAVVAWWVLASRTRFPLWGALLLGVASGIGRIYMGVHYPADVLASLLLAPLFAWAFVALWERGESAVREGWTPPSWLSARREVVGLVVLLLYLAGLTLAVLGPLDPSRLRRWELVGIAYGGPLAVVLQLTLWPEPSMRRGAAPALVGAAGVALLAALTRAWLPGPIWLGAVAVALALVWIFVGVPALFSGRTRHAMTGSSGR